ncbi:MAG: hypothetical protein J5732_06770 [Bacteroidaceae bacterium]|nr:hypothetical protein [Bacteroidaceae bacterium]
MCNENIKFDELDEFRDTLQLMDEKLESQEIVTPEQIRTATMEKVDMLETGVKTTLIWGYLIGFPLLTLILHLSRGLSNVALWTAGIFGFISIVINAFILRKVSRKDFVQLDLYTLMTRERRFRRIFLVSAASTFIFWIVYGYVFISVACGIIYTLMLVAMDIPRFYHSFIRAYKEGLQGKLDERDTLLGRIGKVVRIVLLLICALALLIGFVLYVIGAFKTYPDEGFNWLFVAMPVVLLSGFVAMVPLIINSIRNNKVNGLPTISVVAITVCLVFYTVIFIHDFAANRDIKSTSTYLFMLIVAIWIIDNAYRNRH